MARSESGFPFAGQVRNRKQKKAASEEEEQINKEIHRPKFRPGVWTMLTLAL